VTRRPTPTVPRGAGWGDGGGFFDFFGINQRPQPRGGRYYRQAPQGWGW
jgi:hypothetical protein